MGKKTGRPSKYKEEYCQMLIDHMKEGLSFESFAGLIRVNQDTLHEWVKVYKEFSEAKKCAYELSRLFWEQLGIDGCKGKIFGFNATVYVFTMKNRFGWRSEPEQQNETPISIVVNNNKNAN